VTSVVLDASALLAVLNAEPGADVVRAALANAIISAVNYSEVLKKTIERGGGIREAAAIIRDLSVAVIPFDEEHAAASAELYPQGKPHGMSSADRACLALGVQRKLTVLTAERKMRLLALPIKVKLIRNAH
jgi:PIN domain nuclease of toxin-antitoxin system